ncbi:titin-like isoform X2 [Thalassophryne amazonica]|uniref:titin-like isoform X2 n=1 Tax=Thalassophryne amazonica TaxID=390379 RepID=UPI0014718194|nr:titin-like isoform X2 [Thalassophryne amazonica]
MPSKRKKNKRRMRRVQAMMKAPEEQPELSQPIKTKPRVAVSAPPAADPKKAAKTPASAPDKIPKAVIIAEMTNVVPEPITEEPIEVPVPVQVQSPKPEVVVLEETLAEGKAAALGTEEVLNSQPEETSTTATTVQETETISPEIVTEVDEDPEPTVELETLSEEVEVKEAVPENVATPEFTIEGSEEQVLEGLKSDSVSVPAAAAQPAVDELVIETLPESAEDITEDTPETEQVTEAVVDPVAPTDEEEGEAEVEDIPQVTEEAADIIKELDTVPEALVEMAQGHLIEIEEEVNKTPAGECVITAEDDASDQCVTDPQETTCLSDSISTESETVNISPADPEPAAGPVEEVPTDVINEHTSLAVLPEEPMSDISDSSCQLDLTVESLHLNSVVNCLISLNFVLTSN